MRALPISLHPPNSQAKFNVLFQSPADEVASAQVEAFRDTWTWLEEAEWSYKEVMRFGGGAARLIDVSDRPA